MDLRTHPFYATSNSSVHRLLRSKAYREGRKSVRCSSSSPNPSNKMSEEISGSKLMEFPHLCNSHRDLMVELVSTIENRFDSHLLPSAVPSDVQYYQNQNGNSQGSLHIRSGVQSSPIDFILASWLHLKQPTGGAFNITNIAGYLKSTNDIPHFQFELVQCTPTFLILFLDLIPRKDIILHPDYLKTFYEETQLETRRQELAGLVEVQPYFSSSLYFRKVVSPTGILIRLKCEDGGVDRVEEIVRENISPISKEVLRIWIDLCLFGGREIREESEKNLMRKRDLLIRSKAVEMDLSSSMPLQFGEEVAQRVMSVIRNAFNL